VRDHVRPKPSDNVCGDAVAGEITVLSPYALRLVPALRPKLLEKRAAEEATRSRHEHLHRPRVYGRLLAALVAFACAGCGAAHRPAARAVSLRALDAQQQRLVADYQPVSVAMYRYDVSYRAWQSGVLGRRRLAAVARGFRSVVLGSRVRLVRDSATGGTARAKRHLLAALDARRRALDALIAKRSGYDRHWNRSIVEARKALTKLQDIRDKARLIPIPEDSVS
jgi:hypothetical protein